MSLTPEQVMATHKGNMETLFGLANKAFDGLEKMVELNLSTSRAALTDAGTQMQSLLSAKDPQELLTLQTTMLQPLAEKIASYNRQMYEIASATSAEFTKALEAQTADAQKAFTTLIDSTAKNAPAGSETAVAVMNERRLRRHVTLSSRCKKPSSKPPTWPKPTSAPWPKQPPMPPSRLLRASVEQSLQHGRYTAS